jgi:hypothetical protein
MTLTFHVGGQPLANRGPNKLRLHENLYLPFQSYTPTPGPSPHHEYLSARAYRHRRVPVKAVFTNLDQAGVPLLIQPSFEPVYEKGICG